MKQTVLRDDTYDIAIWQISTGFTDAISSYMVKYFATESSLGCITQPEVVEKITNTYSDELKNTFSLGSYNLFYGSNPTPFIVPKEYFDVQRPMSNWGWPQIAVNCKYEHI